QAIAEDMQHLTRGDTREADAPFRGPAQPDQHGERQRQPQLHSHGALGAEQGDQLTAKNGVHRLPSGTPSSACLATVMKASSKSVCTSRNWVMATAAETNPVRTLASSSSRLPVWKRTVHSAGEPRTSIPGSMAVRITRVARSICSARVSKTS